MRSILLDPALWILLLSIETGWILSFHLDLDLSVGILSGIIMGFIFVIISNKKLTKG